MPVGFPKGVDHLESFGGPILICIGIFEPLLSMSRTTSGPRNRLWESLIYTIVKLKL